MANLLDTTINGNLNVTGHIINGGVVRYDINNQGLTDTQKSNVRTNIGAGTSNFTGYTTSNKLSTNCINNEAGWTAITINTTNKTISDGTNTLTFGDNAFNSTAIPTTYVSTVNGSSGAITNVAKTDTANIFTNDQTLNNNKYLKGKDTSGTARDLIGYDSYNSICLGNSTHNLFAMTNLNTYPTDTNSLGSSTYKWKDLYLSGNLSDGTNSISISDIPNRSEIPATYVSTITTAAGTHTTITSSSGSVSFNVPTKTSHLTNDSGFVTSSGVTSIATSGTGLSGGPITLTGTITLDSSSAGNAAADKVVLRNATGSIQSEKIAISSGATTKVNMQYNSTEDCVEFIFA